MSKFKHYPRRPERLTAAFTKAEYAKLLARLPAAEASKTPAQWLRLYADWNDLKSYIGSEGSRLNHSFCMDMHDHEAETADKYFREKIVLEVDEPEHTLTKAFLASKHKNALAKRYGQQLIPVYQSALRPLDPVNTKLGIKDSKLTTKYDKKIARAAIKIRGENVTLWKARSYGMSENTNLRKEAFMASRTWFIQNHKELSDIYDRLIKLRHQMGKNLGYSSFVPLAYESRGRTDYGIEEVSDFRASVRKYVLPIRVKLAAQHARSLGASTLRPWDVGYNPQHSLPLGIVPVNEQLDQAHRLFGCLSPKLDKHFDYMRGHGLIDLENRVGKRSGAYCTHFSDEGLVAIFCNSTGDADDVHTLTHEMGHAFQGWESQHIETVDLQWGTADLAEVSSMGMEFLCLPYIYNFFSEEESKKFAKHRWDEALGILCYVCVVDEFQHWVYEHPGASSVERDEQWCRISAIYQPEVDWSGYEKFQKTRWYMQPHIFDIPFYYIDYALAEVCAMQLAILNEKDHDQAMKTYFKLCCIGGSKSFLAALLYAGLRSPFDEKLIKDLASVAAKTLET